MDSFRKVNPGDPLVISATSFNTLMDVAKLYRAGGIGGSRGASRSGRDSGIVLIENTTDDDFQIRSPMRITGLAIQPETDDDSELLANQVLAGGAMLGEADPLAVVLDRIPAHGIGRAQISGACAVRLRIEAESHRGAIPYWLCDSKQFQTVGAGGYPILWKESGTGDKWGVILLRRDAQWMGRIDTEIGGAYDCAATYYPETDDERYWVDEIVATVGDNGKVTWSIADGRRVVVTNILDELGSHTTPNGRRVEVTTRRGSDGKTFYTCTTVPCGYTEPA